MKIKRQPKTPIERMLMRQRAVLRRAEEVTDKFRDQWQAAKVKSDTQRKLVEALERAVQAEVAP